MGRNNSSDLLDKWLEDDNLLLLEAWARDGYTLTDIARRIGINLDTLVLWKKKYEPIKEALSIGKELVDYKVENALLKSALGYRTKDVKVTTTMRYGKVVETIKETTDREVAPNVTAIQMWLYNRQKDKWKNMSSSKSMLDEMGDDSTIEITVTRASKNESGFESPQNNTDSDGKDTDAQENKKIKLRKRTKEEAEEYREKQKVEKAKLETGTIVDESDESVSDLDEWPEDWEDDD